MPNQKACVLVVEDTADTRRLLQFLLTEAGYDVRLAADGAAALRLLLHLRPDVIITDLKLPEVEGLELIRQIRAKGALAHTPIVAITAYGSEEEALQVGASAVLAKPEGTLKVVETVQRLLGR